jgi:hypothetical protein
MKSESHVGMFMPSDTVVIDDERLGTGLGIQTLDLVA